MKIKIYKDESKTLFSYNGNSFEFNYDNINTFITERLKNLSESIEFETDEDLNDYQELLTKINSEISKEDFINAAKQVEEIKKELDEADSSLESE